MIRSIRQLKPFAFGALLGTGACSNLQYTEDDLSAANDVAATRQGLTQARHQEATTIGAGPWVTSPSALSALAVASIIGDTDAYTAQRSKAHFDNCYWAEGREFMMEKRRDAVEAAVNGDVSGAYDAFGYVLHAVQDFYSHSSWVDTHGSGTIAAIDETPTAPPGWYSGTCSADDQSGSGCNNAGDYLDNVPQPGYLHCPENYREPHEQMNKDDIGDLSHDEAQIDAVVATGDQIRRLIEAIRARTDVDGSRVLNNLGLVTTNPATTASRTDYRRTTIPPGGPWGQRGQSVFCRPGTYVAAFRQRVESDQAGADDTGLNAIEFYCKSPSGNWVERLNTWDGAWGDWSRWVVCPSGFIVGGALKVQPEQGYDADDAAATGSRFRCSDSSLIAASNDAPWGWYRAEGNCAVGEAVCGAQVFVEPPIGGGWPPDDTALNGIRLHCCKL